MSASLLAVGAASTVEAAPGDLPIIDPHQHLWDFARFRPPWLNGVPALNKSHTMQDYLKAAEGLNVVKTVYMEVDVDPRQQLEEAEYVIKISDSEKTPMVGGVISGRPASPDFEAYVRRFQGSPYIKGVRQVIHVPETPAGYCLQPNFVRSIRLLGDLGLSFDLCMRHAELRDGIRLVDLCPGTRFVLDHCGNPDIRSSDNTQWKKDMLEFARRKNVVGKVSGIIAQCQPGMDKNKSVEPFVRHTIEAFGWDRVMFASDWPVCTLGATYKEWVEAAKYAVRDAKLEDQKKLFHDNAKRFYRI